MSSRAFLFLFLILFSCNKNDDSSGYEKENNLISTTQLDELIPESSGLIKFNQQIWTHNDSGDLPNIYSISEFDGHIQNTVTISNALHADWEDLAQDDTFLYIGDFGNNEGNRQDLVIYKIPKTELQNNPEAEKIYFSFSDQNTFDNSNSMHNFNCEAMITLGDYIYLFSKNHLDEKTKLYRLSKEPGEQIAQKIANFNSDGLITGADLDESNNILCLIGYNLEDPGFSPFVWIFYNFDGTDFFNGDSKRVNLSISAQMEGICSNDDFTFIISSENETGGNGNLYIFDVQKWIN